MALKHGGCFVLGSDFLIDIIGVWDQLDRVDEMDTLGFLRSNHVPREDVLPRRPGMFCHPHDLAAVH